MLPFQNHVSHEEKVKIIKKHLHSYRPISKFYNLGIFLRYEKISANLEFTKLEGCSKFERGDFTLFVINQVF